MKIKIPNIGAVISIHDSVIQIRVVDFCFIFQDRLLFKFIKREVIIQKGRFIILPEVYGIVRTYEGMFHYI